MQTEARKAEADWYLFALAGVANLVIGVLVLAYPDVSVNLLGIFLGIDLLIGAVLLLVRGVSGPSAEGSPAGTLLLGILALIAGVVVIRNPGETLALVAIAFAIFMIVAGALALADAIVDPDRRLVSLAKGVALVAAGTLIVSWPSIGVGTLVLIAGISLCIQGIFEIVEALLLRSLRARPA